MVFDRKSGPGTDPAPRHGVAIGTFSIRPGGACGGTGRSLDAAAQPSGVGGAASVAGRCGATRTVGDPASSFCSDPHTAVSPGADGTRTQQQGVARAAQQQDAETQAFAARGGERKHVKPMDGSTTPAMPEIQSAYQSAAPARNREDAATRPAA